MMMRFAKQHLIRRQETEYSTGRAHGRVVGRAQTRDDQLCGRGRHGAFEVLARSVTLNLPRIESAHSRQTGGTRVWSR